jgi:hypothetical protein
MMKQTLTIPGQLPTLNETINDCKRHWSLYHAKKKKFTTLISLAVSHLKPIEGQVHLSFRWFTQDKRTDPDNIAAGGRKVILDGLVKGGILPGDSFGHIASFSDVFAIDRGNPRVEVEIARASRRK